MVRLCSINELYRSELNEWSLIISSITESLIACKLSQMLHY